MPDITADDLYHAGKIPGLEFLENQGQEVGIIFSGLALAGSVEVGYLNDVGVFVPVGDPITELPSDTLFQTTKKGGVYLNVSGGGANFNISSGGVGNNIG